VRFEFRGKSGKAHAIDVRNRKLAAIVKRCRDLPGYELFQYIDENGDRQVIDSSDVNQYVREITGEDFTAKDFRTWAATVLACTSLNGFSPPATRAQAKKNVLTAIEAVAGVLGNTRAVCRKSYIHPAVLDAYDTGLLARTCARRRTAKPRLNGLRHDELMTLALLRKCERRPLPRAA